MVYMSTVMDSLYSFLIVVRECGHQYDKVEGVNIK